jgi:hypothetical protein
MYPMMVLKLKNGTRLMRVLWQLGKDLEYVFHLLGRNVQPSVGESKRPKKEVPSVRSTCTKLVLTSG